MKIITLVENTTEKEECIAEHGLSIYIETEKHKLLLDTGQTDAVVRNAETLGIDLTAVDTIILSHGHYDHSGGILPFSKLNRTAQIIMQRTAAEPHYNGERYIGLDTDILKLPNVCLIDGDKQLDDELTFLLGGQELIYRDRVNDEAYLIEGETFVYQSIESLVMIAVHFYDVIAHVGEPVYVTSDSDLGRHR